MPPMTRKKQQESLRKADSLLSQAHSLVLDVSLARQESGELIPGDALSTVLGHCNKAIDILRDCGESPDYYAAWERPPDEPGP